MSTVSKTKGETQFLEIVDPWSELKDERERHRATLRLLHEYYKRASLLNAAGYPSTMQCKLCEKVPAHDGLHRRQTCPHHHAPHALEQTDRLMLEVVPSRTTERQKKHAELSDLI